MKALLTDFVRDANITSLFPTQSFPPRNLKSTFLDTLYVATTGSDVVTIDLGQNKQLDSIYFAGCNCESVGLVIKNSSGFTTYSATVPITREIESHYFTEITGRTLILTLDTPAPTTMVKMKGVGCGKAFSASFISEDLSPELQNQTSSTRTVTGQVLRNETPTFRAFTITIPGLTSATYKAALSALKSLGIHKPTYWDFTEETKDFEDPIYAEIPAVWKPIPKPTHYSVEIPILECR